MREWSKAAHSYQKRGVKFLLSHGAAALLLDPGMGKTSVVLKALAMLKQAKTNRLTLVIAPLRVAQLVWPTEPGEWSDLAHMRVGVLHGKGKEDVLADRANYDILVINPEGLEWLLLGKKGATFSIARWKKLGFDTLVIDELTKFKTPKGQRFKLMKQVIGTFQRRWGLTGTPAPNGLMDLFGQMYMLDQGNALGPFITHYRMKYFVPLDQNGWNWALRAGADVEIYERLKPLAMRASAEDYLELPEIVPLKIYIDLPPKVRQLYDTLEDDLLAKIADRQVVAANAAAASTKCRQVANGAVYIDDDVASKVEGKKRDVLELHDEKIKALRDLVDGLVGEPLLVAYEFNHDLARLRKAFPEAHFMADAKTAAKGAAMEADWNDGKIVVLFGHPASMGHGLNMQKGNAAHVAWFSMFWDLELYDQFIKRVARQGNKAKRVFVHHFMARDTVDQVVYYAQKRKTKTQLNLLDALQGRKSR